MVAREHDIDCPLYPAHWLRRALEAVEQMVAGDPDGDADRLSAAALLNGLQHYAHATGWEVVTLRDVAEYATLMSEEQFPPCDCIGPSKLRW
ncbi:hypothetical protein [Trujillonella endophytica]|uniref:hypothetical protein n=1 Tax=Trujillonella endophytica TaxID=673521 RepID=UPI001113DBB2|nr:hypothetical protein [Trujillella endophytica]